MTDHRPSMVLELVNRPPSYGMYCLKCSKPWPCLELENTT